MVYIIFSNNDKVAKGEYSFDTYPTLEFISLDKEKAVNFLEKERYRYFNMENNEIEEDSPNEFGVQVEDWWYHYWLEEYPEDTNLRAYWIEKNNIF
ncbi:MAG: hypothetical protein IJH39_11915 [Clostridia bacterium]|nr:hypothetical protein [Clostridia bacterium]